MPHDANALDNHFEFVFAEPAVQKTVIVSDNADVAELLRLAASTPSDRSLVYDAQVVSPAQAALIEWNKTALVIWHAPLPDDVLAKQMESFVAMGGCLMFLPADEPGDKTLFGTRWGVWKEPEGAEQFALSRWRTDADLLANSLSGTPLPVGQVVTYRNCEVLSETGTVLAQLEKGPPLLLRAATDQGAVWFCSTLPTTDHSNFVSNGITFYVMIQRAVARGAAALGAARQYECGTVPEAVTEHWTPLEDASKQVLLSQRSINAGLYETPDASFALNRPLSEDAVELVSPETLEQVMSGLNYTRIDDQAGSAMALASEVWRTFLMLMIVALLAEALLSVPDPAPPAVEAKTTAPRENASAAAPFPWKSAGSRTNETASSGKS